MIVFMISEMCVNNFHQLDPLRLAMCQSCQPAFEIGNSKFCVLHFV